MQDFSAAPPDAKKDAMDDLTQVIDAVEAHLLLNKSDFLVSRAYITCSLAESSAYYCETHLC